MMRKSALAIGVAATAFAVPATARDGDAYIGADAGVVVLENTQTDVIGIAPPVTTAYQTGW